jgi:hypothetical protein
VNNYCIVRSKRNRLHGNIMHLHIPQPQAFSRRDKEGVQQETEIANSFSFRENSVLVSELGRYGIWATGV